MKAPTHARRPRRYRLLLAAFRVVLITFVVTIMAFCVALLFGIVGIVLTKMIRGGPGPNLALAYRHIALPVAIAVLVVAFIITLIVEVRHYRRERAAITVQRGNAA